jgi:hypothetical protein
LLEQTTLTDRAWITFGDRPWRDYDYKVTDPEGKVLLEGLPDLNSAKCVNRF